MAKSIYVPITRIVTKRLLQRREQESAETIARYAEIFTEAMEQSTEPPFPPLVVFAENPKDEAAPLLLSDGFHRLKGGRKATIENIKVEIRKGGEREALLYALSANADHGLPLTLAERRANATALLADEEWRQWSDREISTHVHLSPNTVGKIRKQQGAVTDKVKGKDGVVRKKASAKKPANNDEFGVDGLVCDDVNSRCTIQNDAGDIHRASGKTLDFESCMVLSALAYHGELTRRQVIVLNRYWGKEVEKALESTWSSGLICNRTENDVVFYRLSAEGEYLVRKSDNPGAATPAPTVAPTVATTIAKLDETIANFDYAQAALPPGPYLDGSIVLLSSEPLPPELVVGCAIATSDGRRYTLAYISGPHLAKGCAYYGLGVSTSDDDTPGTINEVVFFRGELRHLFANNTNRLAIGTKKPKKAKDDHKQIQAEAQPLPVPAPEPQATEQPDPADDITVPDLPTIAQCVLADFPRLMAAKVHGPSELIAKVVAALYHSDSRKQPQGTWDIALLTRLPVTLIDRVVDTYPAGIELGIGGYQLTEAADAAVDAVLGEHPTAATQATGSEPEELTLPEVAAPPRPARHTAPLAERRAGWIRQQLAEQLERGPQLRCSEAETCALILLVGIDTRDGERWDEDFVQGSLTAFNERVAHSVADRLRRHETHHLPDWRLLARFFGVDADSLSILAERTIPE